MNLKKLFPFLLLLSLVGCSKRDLQNRYHWQPGPGGFDSPMGVAVAPDGTIAVAEAGAGRITLLAPDGARSASFSSALQRPFDVAFGPDGNLYVADYDLDAIVVLARDGTVRRRFGEGLNAPAGLDVGPDGTVYVADFYNHRVLAYGSRTQEWKGFHYPTDVTLTPAGTLLVADAFDHRIVNLSTGQRIGSRWNPFAPRFDTPVSVASDDAGNLFVADSGHHEVVAVSPTAAELARWRLPGPETPQHTPSRIVRAGGGGFWVVDTPGGRLLKLVATAGRNPTN